MQGCQGYEWQYGSFDWLWRSAPTSRGIRQWATGHPRGDKASLKAVGADRDRLALDDVKVRLVTRLTAGGAVLRYGALVHLLTGRHSAGS